LDAKPNSNNDHRPLRREWVGCCPSTKSMGKRQIQHDTPIQKNRNDNLPSSIRRLNKRPNISSFRPMPYHAVSNP
jgi:hypothetical protein